MKLLRDAFGTQLELLLAEWSLINITHSPRFLVPFKSTCVESSVWGKEEGKQGTHPGFPAGWGWGCSLARENLPYPGTKDSPV